MSAEMVGLSIILIGILLLVGKWIRVRFSVFQKYFLPSSILGGFIALLLGPEVFGKLIGQFQGNSSLLSNGVFPEDVLSSWLTLPGLLISVIFATLFLGKKIPNIKDIWLTTGPQVSFGQTVAWGQYVFGLLLTITLLTPFFGINPMAGALIEIGFEGGHGTSAGLSETFQQLGFADGANLAIGLATVGVVSGVVTGIILINIAVKKNKTNVLKDPSNLPEDKLRGIIKPDDRPSAGKMTTQPESIEPLALHIAIIGVAIFVGKILLEALIYVESITWGADTEIFTHLPLFPLAMVGGVILQTFIDKSEKFNLIDRKMILRIQGLALDFLIVSAIATLSLTVIGENFLPFLLLALTGISWNIVAFIFLAPRMIPENWFERGIGDYGQSMGMTAAGLMLIRIADSKGETKALEAFGYKQLMFEPLVGGGLFTAASLPLIYEFGPVPILFLCLAIMIVWLIVGIFYFGKK
ncbi:ESS family glutamate:Na+ symporter [Metabacillus crassostreae]|uniref:sodium/glutamate symporter n=1 Tax=Metabacillus crassostreae TaxID=929098 RepID=UPI00195D081E|nr:sodium/glutamate symporter [Metabacillus crassostreae]MBM7604882.1 ESS family glutamate:Na+ symporter [Metabacillus crassostreae]